MNDRKKGRRGGNRDRDASGGGGREREIPPEAEAEVAAVSDAEAEAEEDRRDVARAIAILADAREESIPWEEVRRELDRGADGPPLPIPTSCPWGRGSTGGTGWPGPNESK